jgi:DNA-binding NarL/FixJ family response regulator
MTEGSQISLVIADDHASMRSALGELVESEPRIRLVGLAAEATEAVALVLEREPDVLVLDVRMPGGGAGVARTVAGIAPATRIVALSAQDDAATRRSMMEAGVYRYLVKGVSGAAILGAILAAWPQ